jgi:iron complex outermembrane receptor protein
MSSLPLTRIVLAAVFGLVLSFGAASQAATEDEVDASAASSPEAEAEIAAELGDESEGDESEGDEPEGDESEGDESEAAAPTRRDDVEELYVTATKREEALQDVPISMSALDSNTLEDSGITGFGQISEYVPNLTINPVTDTRGTIMRIRGIGSVGSNAGIDPSVGVFIDGVYQGRAGMSVGDLLDIERVEVLRGPQGTLYGKNTAAGLINVISKRPVYEWETVAEFVYGNFSNFEGRASVNVPIVDEHIAGRFSGYAVVRDGFDERLKVGGREYGFSLDDPDLAPNFPPPDTELTNPAPDYPFLPRPEDDDRFVYVADRVNDADKWGAKGRLLFDVTDGLSFLVSGDYSFEDTKCCVADILTFEGVPTLSAVRDDNQDPFPLLTFQNLAKTGLNPDWVKPNRFPRVYQSTGIPLPPDDPFDRLVAANEDPQNEVGIGGVAVEASYDFPDMPLIGGSSLDLIGSWRRYTNDSQFDGDFSYYEVARWSTAVDLDQYSVELRLTSPGGELVDYQTGLYFYHQDMHTVDQLRFYWDAINLFFAPNFTPTKNMGDNTHKTYSYAGFGQLTLNPIDQVSVTGGVRITHEKKTRVGSQICDRWQDVGGGVWEWRREESPVFDTPPICGPGTFIGPGENERSVTNVSGMVNLRYFPMEDVMLYASFATGFKSGGFNQLRVSQGGLDPDQDPTPTEFDDEESMNFELGFKTAWFDRMLTLNATAFYTEYEQFQAQLFDGTSVSVRNAGSLESYGVEADLVFVPEPFVPGLVLGSSLGFNIAEYTDFELGEQTAQQRWDATDGWLITGCAPPAPIERCVQDLEGKSLDNAPRWSVSTFAMYEFLLPWLPVEVFWRAEYNFTSSRYLAPDLDPHLKQGATHLVNLRSGFRAEDESWELTGWVRNLTDEKWNVVGFDVPTINGFAAVNGPPRQYGLTVRFNF